ncbi:MAG: hypothetical protein O3C68_01920 [Proteobacteria bacterium]|nr:hypothetical protein [Pseudomonadota bacterium]
MKIPWHVAMRHDIHRVADDNRDYPAFFGVSSRQTDALVADRS